LEAGSGAFPVGNKTRSKVFCAASVMGLFKRRHNEKGLAMHTVSFDRPLTVLVGLGFPRKIAGLRAALDMLEDHPMNLRDEAYEATLAACRAALAGEATMGEAHDVFAAFVRRRGMLVEEPLVEPRTRATERLRA
jgi:hypothetical protein